MTSRTAARDAALATARTVSAAVAVLSLTAGGALLGLVSRPRPAAVVPAAAAVAPAQPNPKRTVYVRVPAPVRPVVGRSVVQPPRAARRPIVQPPPRAPRRVRTPAVATSRGS